MANNEPPSASKKSVGLFWESEVVTSPSGEVTVTPLQPISHLTRKQAAKALGCTVGTVTDLFRLGMLEGYKPGGWRKRSDGRPSNAVLKLCSASVLRYRERQVLAAKQWQAEQQPG